MGAFFTILIIAVALAVIGFLLRQRPFREERARALSLATAGTRTPALVRAWSRESATEKASNLRLTVSFAAHGVEREVEVPVRVDKDLIIGFAPGTTIHLLIDPADPARVCVDRSLSPVEVPRS